jgi:uncharacterized protein (TIGR03067 family)
MKLGIACLASCCLLVASAQLGYVAADGRDKMIDKAKLVGNWKITSGMLGDKKVSADDLKNTSAMITKDSITAKDAEVTVTMEYTLDTAAKPAIAKFTITKFDSKNPLPKESPVKIGARAQGIVELDGDELRICYNPDGGPAPKSFDVKGTKNHMFVLKRVK